MRRRTLFLLFLLALSACRSKTVEQGVLVTVKADSDVAGIVQLKVTVTNAGTDDHLLLPGVPQNKPMVFPTEFSISTPSSRTGRVTLVIEGIDSSGYSTASGNTFADLVANTYVPTSVGLHLISTTCGNGESCLDASVSPEVGAGADTGGEITSDSGDTPDIPVATGGAGGVEGSGGITGSGGLSGTSGATGIGGMDGTGGASGSGGILGTGGNTSVACSPACSTDQDCVGGFCLPSTPYGMGCTTTQDCPSNATCCDGSSESCDGTRLPTGDGTNDGEFVASLDGLTVTDLITGLVWQRDGSGPRAGCAKDPNCTWAEAKAYCASLVLGGVSGWRLPGRMELHTIVDLTRTSPSIDSTAFLNTPTEYFLTSSQYTGSSGGAWCVDFSSGISLVLVGGTARARCVR